MPRWIAIALVIIVFSSILLPLGVGALEGLLAKETGFLGLYLQQFALIVLSMAATFTSGLSQPLRGGAFSGLRMGLIWSIPLLFLNLLGARLNQWALSLFMAADRIASMAAEESRMAEGLVSQGHWQLVSGFFLICILAPVAEEVFFRGYLFRQARKSWGVGFGILFSALFFALPHFYIAHFGSIFLLGVALAGLYQRTNSLWVPIGAHAGVNAIVFLMILMG